MPTLADLATTHGVLNMNDVELLARTHAARLASFLRRRVGTRHDVEDLVLDTLLEAVRCVDRFQGQPRPGTWLFGIALNLTRNHHKRAKVRDANDSTPGAAIDVRDHQHGYLRQRAA
jgi:DNA-directed RNA polymerase specialized sigma24 family protein